MKKIWLSAHNQAKVLYGLLHLVYAADSPCNKIQLPLLKIIHTCYENALQAY